MRSPQRQLVLNKGAERYIFRYKQGQEDQLLDALIDQVKDRRTDFDWFDAAVISFRMTEGMLAAADELCDERERRYNHARGEKPWWRGMGGGRIRGWI